MFNLKLSAIAAGAALILSLLLALISGVRFPIALARALVLAVAFGLGAALFSFLISRFLPELLDDTASGGGSLVDISVGDDDSSSFPAGSPEAGAGDDFAGFMAAAGNSLDQDGKDGYTDGEGLEEGLAGSAGDSGLLSAAAVPGEDSDGVDVLPGEGGGSDSFLSSLPGGKPSKPGNGALAGSLGDDFNPQEMASAIQTILKRDEKG